MMMRKHAFVALVAGFVFVGSAYGQSADKQQCSATKDCPTAKKVRTLLASWEEVAQQSKSASPEAKAQCAKKIASVAEKCPVGCRMSDTLAVVNDVLTFVSAQQAANAQHCPLNKADAKSASCATAIEMKTARVEVINGLTKLAGYTSGAACQPSTCKTATNESRCSTPPCPIRIASRIGAMKASFAQAKKEANSLSPKARGEIMASFASLSESNQAVKLVPASVEALAEGLTALTKINGKMGEWAAAHPEMLKSVPDSVRQSFMMEGALIEETRGLLTDVMDTMKTMQAPVKTVAAGNSQAR